MRDRLVIRIIVLGLSLVVAGCVDFEFAQYMPNGAYVIEMDEFQVETAVELDVLHDDETAGAPLSGAVSLGDAVISRYAPGNSRLFIELASLSNDAQQYLATVTSENINLTPVGGVGRVGFSNSLGEVEIRFPQAVTYAKEISFMAQGVSESVLAVTSVICDRTTVSKLELQPRGNTTDILWKVRANEGCGGPYYRLIFRTSIPISATSRGALNNRERRVTVVNDIAIRDS